jgi:hypothetical protein
LSFLITGFSVLFHPQTDTDTKYYSAPVPARKKKTFGVISHPKSLANWQKPTAKPDA